MANNNNNRTYAHIYASMIEGNLNLERIMNELDDEIDKEHPDGSIYSMLSYYFYLEYYKSLKQMNKFKDEYLLERINYYHIRGLDNYDIYKKEISE